MPLLNCFQSLFLNIYGKNKCYTPKNLGIFLYNLLVSTNTKKFQTSDYGSLDKKDENKHSSIRKLDQVCKQRLRVVYSSNRDSGVVEDEVNKVNPMLQWTIPQYMTQNETTFIKQLNLFFLFKQKITSCINKKLLLFHVTTIYENSLREVLIVL